MSPSRRETVVVVCPGRGSYGREQLGYLAKHTGDQRAFVERVDRQRLNWNELGTAELDLMKSFASATHGIGKNAAALIYACSMVDFLALDQSRYEIVAIAGNSMGWYLALSAAACVEEHHALSIIQTMGAMMGSSLIGGQLIYPRINEQWRYDDRLANRCALEIQRINSQSSTPMLYPSIELGGYQLIGGEMEALKALAANLPKIEDRYPAILAHHAAFHTPLLQPVSELACEQLPVDWFQKPRFPLIDGRGQIWQPYSTIPADLWRYTFGHQVTQVYNFTSSIRVALREFAPDKVVLLGPGESLGSIVAQIMIQEKWRGIDSKSAFKALQADDAFVLSFARPADHLRLTTKLPERMG